MKEIPLTQGRVALVDDEDYERVSRHKWFAHKNKKVWYAMRTMPVDENGKRKTQYLHQFVLDGSGTPIDHRDGNGLNNVRSNLRECTTRQNMHNQRIRETNTSGYRGVSFSRRSMKWHSQICHNGKIWHLGYFRTPQEAATIYDSVARLFYGEYARMNFNG